MNRFEAHHDGSPTYVERQDVGIGDKVDLRVHVPHAADGEPGARLVYLRDVRDGEPRLTAAHVESQDSAGTWWRAPLSVENVVTSYRFLLADGTAHGAGGGTADGARGSAGGGAHSGTGGGAGMRWLNGTGVHARDVTDAADFRLVTHDPPPDWIQDQVIYQVFPDRFARSAAAGPLLPDQLPDWAVAAGWDDPVAHQGRLTGAQLYGGDLDGVIEHLDHLLDLGVTALYLTPVFEARSNHRYDAVSFDQVDPLLGGDAAWHRLIDAAHRAGLRVIGDLTTNHTGVEHGWFRAAQADPDSVEATFYRFRDHPDSYQTWLNVPSLPKLDHTSPELRRRLYDGPASVTARWLRDGLDGWRIDVANMTGRSGAVDLAASVAQAVRRTAAQTAPQAWVLAEHGHDASLELAGDGWHGTMDYSGFTRPVWSWLGPGDDPQAVPHELTFLGLPIGIPLLDGRHVVATMRDFHAAMPWRSWQSSTSHLDSHDTPRFRTVTGGGRDGGVDAAGRGRARHLVGLALQLTMPGVPSIFMGDELGLTAVDGEHARTPFPWQRPQTWDSATLSAYREWIALRRGQVALRRGGLRWVAVGPDSMTFLREHPQERLLVHLARRAHTPVSIPLGALGLSHAEELVALLGEPAGCVAGVLRLPASGPGGHVYRLDVD